MQFHRESKNRPREMSSRKPVPVFRDIFQVSKKHVRDPRFDDLSGTFDKEEFERNFEWIEEIKCKEKMELEKELKNAESPHKRHKIIDQLQRIRNQELCKKIETKKKAEEYKQREEIIATLNEGKKPYIPKKSEIKKKKLIEKFQSLKKSGKLDKHIEKRRKKMFCKDKKHFYK